ncbi:hypothetical protein PILCRDRAFT_470242 [Piloderma croceum F 1598]|uniref:Uncharacterized protein n=1 Tax=Piloderma croceum (strain F 1598) TaxID=765440 RepID=A0A0C3FC33_PILCF|nr:hypothetical protein PILCRDRAFT_470242 [Piloderma croceum F 1598]
MLTFITAQQRITTLQWRVQNKSYSLFIWFEMPRVVGVRLTVRSPFCMTVASMPPRATQSDNMQVDQYGVSPEGVVARPNDTCDSARASLPASLQ